MNAFKVFVLGVILVFLASMVEVFGGSLDGSLKELVLKLGYVLAVVGGVFLLFK